MVKVLILGGGFGGLTVARELADRRLPGVEVTLIDQRPSYVMGLAKLWALDGRRPLEQGRREYRALEARGVRFVRSVVRSIHLGDRTVRTDDASFSCDHLVVALGAELAPEKLAGFDPTMDLYTEAGVEHLRRALATFQGGRIVVMVAGLPFKCPPAPYEAAMLVESMMRQRGLRERVEIRLTTPEPHPLPIAAPHYGEHLTRLLAQKNIDYLPSHKPVSIEQKTRLIHYENGAKVDYNLLLGIPLHRAPQVVRDAQLTDDSGWIPVDPATLRTRHEGVWAIGDVAGVRLANGKLLPKAGTLAAGEGRVVAAQIAAEIQGQAPPAATFDGRGVCYIETGDGLAVPGRGSFYDAPAPTFDLAPPSPEGLSEKEAFEREFLARWFG